MAARFIVERFAPVTVARNLFPRTSLTKQTNKYLGVNQGLLNHTTPGSNSPGSIAKRAMASAPTAFQSRLPAPKEIDENDGKLKALAYRARQRGWLEVDWLVGGYAEQQLANLSESQIEEFKGILDEENIDLYNWLSGIEPVPERFNGNSVFEQLVIFTNEDHPAMQKKKFATA